MDVYDIRRENLQRLVEEAGGQTALADKMGTHPSVFSQILGPAQSRNVGARLARRVEQVFGKPLGWLDTLEHPKGGGPTLSGYAARIARSAEKLGPAERRTLESVLAALLQGARDTAPRPRK